MNSSDLELYIRAFAATDNEPVLGQGEIELLIAGARRMDSSYRAYTDANWVETYDVSWAISRAWEMKAGKAAGKYTFLQGGNQFIRSDMIRHCTQMADRWKRGVYASILTDTPPTAGMSFDILYGGHFAGT